jgi:hypothetical protein
MQISTPLLGDLSGNKESFEFLFDKKYSLKDVGELFRQQYMEFRGEIVTSRVSRDSLRDLIVLEEGGQIRGYVSSLANKDEDDMFRFDSEDSVEITERFYKSLKLRFHQD